MLKFYNNFLLKFHAVFTVSQSLLTFIHFLYETFRRVFLKEKVLTKKKDFNLNHTFL
jgi:hypothetical protein